MQNLQGGKSAGSHITILDFLRGLAALSVVMFHFSGSALPTIKPNLMTDFFSIGHLGVQVFFVISGFIIPYSMYAGGYNIRKAGKFIIRRLTRIGPPSWIAILLVVAMYYGAIAMNGKPIEGMHWPGTSVKTILSNLFYSFTLFDTKAFIDVYWTLEVEFQFYILMAILLPVILNSASKPVQLTLILILLNSTFYLYDGKILFLRDNSFFILGILLFLYRTGKISRQYFTYASLVTIIACYSQQGSEKSFAAIIAFLVIAFVNFRSVATTFLGKISYSLYITHMFSGVIAEFILRNLTGHNPPEAIKVIMIFVYSGCAIIFAYLFYLVVEKPFIKLSKQIR